MKTIKEAAKEAYNKLGDNAYFENGFKAGVEFSQQWISVDVELPSKGKTVLVKDANGSVFTGSIGMYGWISERGEYERRTITHWRPIQIE